ncbi:MAG: hypothetical protein BRD47_07640 [Bacteroidetes bacterium QS_8_68_28]|nr:MAG: hypothetical protein BRD47_07640 [Bacteroidetes bacterium QS_8_68_28]
MRAEVLLGAVGVLVIAMAHLRALFPVQSGHEGRVVVHQAQLWRSLACPFGDERVAVLEVAVRDAGVFEGGEHLGPCLRQRVQGAGVVEVLLGVAVERRPLRPVHLQQRERRAVHADALRLVVEADGIGQFRFGEMIGDGAVPLLLVGRLREEALGSQAAALGRGHREDGGEGAGGRARQPQRSGARRRALELLVGEGVLGVLEGLLIGTRARERRRAIGDVRAVALRGRVTTVEG